MRWGRVQERQAEVRRPWQEGWRRRTVLESRVLVQA